MADKGEKVELAQKSADEAEARAKILEGVDFIETEEDAEAVESAVVKIQSTFRGKKIRSKLGQKQVAPPATSTGQSEKSASDSSAKTNDQKAAPQSARTEPETGANSEQKSKGLEEEKQLSSRVASMQVNDNSGDKEAAAAKKSGGNMANLEEEEAAATKIQAGFKGYKTRKELEGKLSQPLANPAGEGNTGSAAGSQGQDEAEAK